MFVVLLAYNCLIRTSMKMLSNHQPILIVMFELLLSMVAIATVTADLHT